MKILVIEDDNETYDAIRRALEEDGCEVVRAESHASGLRAGASASFDVLVADRLLPDGDGLDVVRHLRTLGVERPILVLSALGEARNRIEGLNGGADDYLTKPFAEDELTARVRALARRSRTNAHPEILLLGELEIHMKAMKVHRLGRHIPLSRKEFEVVKLLAHHAGEPVTRTMLLERVWKLHFDPQTNVVDVHVARIRRKLDDGFERPVIRTVRGEGYVLDPG